MVNISTTALDEFNTHQSGLIGLVYRITGSMAEAEDIVQETFLKWADTDHKNIESSRSWLAKIATRMALDYIKSARVKRVSYVGPWLPEPFVEHNRTQESVLDLSCHADGPENELELDESVSMALLLLLQELSSTERAAFILHDLFHFDFEEVGEILSKTGGSCRKMASRARQKIGGDAPQIKQKTDEHMQILSAFFNAVKGGDMAGLVALLKDNVTLHPDGGGKAKALLEVLHGSNAVITFLLDKVRLDFMAVDSGDVVTRVAWFNGSPGLIVQRGDRVVTAFNFGVEEGLIKTIHALRNPDKLRLFRPH